MDNEGNLLSKVSNFDSISVTTALLSWEKFGQKSMEGSAQM
jgi:hypothetical protein